MLPAAVNHKHSQSSVLRIYILYNLEQLASDR
jgi:hypothetical protein